MVVFLLIVCPFREEVIIAKKRLLNRFWKNRLENNLSVVNQAGQWTIPGGSLDKGEGIFTGACREFSEETGITYINEIIKKVIIKDFNHYSLCIAYLKKMEYYNSILNDGNLLLSASEENIFVPKLQSKIKIYEHMMFDWELEQLVSIPLYQLNLYLGVKQEIDNKEVINKIKLRLNEPSGIHSQSIDWNKTIANYVIKNWCFISHELFIKEKSKIDISYL